MQFDICFDTVGLSSPDYLISSRQTITDMKICLGNVYGLCFRHAYSNLLTTCQKVTNFVDERNGLQLASYGDVAKQPFTILDIGEDLFLISGSA